MLVVKGESNASWEVQVPRSAAPRKERGPRMGTGWMEAEAGEGGKGNNGRGREPRGPSQAPGWPGVAMETITLSQPLNWRNVQASHSRA